MIQLREKLIAAAILLFASAAVSSYAAPPGEYQFQNPVPSTSAIYDPNQEQDVAAIANFRHFGNRGSSTNYFITFSAGNSGSFATRWAQGPAGRMVDYQIMDGATTRNVLKDLSAAPGAAEVLSGTNAGSGNLSLSAGFIVEIPGGQLPVAGSYTDSILLTIYAGTLSGTYSALDTESMSVTITVPAIVNLSIVSTGGSFNPGTTAATLDFGALSLGQVRSADLLVQSNASYRVTLQSQNGGVMTNGIAGDTSTVPYTFQFAGSPVGLPSGSPATVVSAGAPTSAGGARYPIVVTIGDFGMATAGSYQDSITITVSAN